MGLTELKELRLRHLYYAEASDADQNLRVLHYHPSLVKLELGIRFCYQSGTPKEILRLKERYKVSLHNVELAVRALNTLYLSFLKDQIFDIRTDNNSLS